MSIGTSPVSRGPILIAGFGSVGARHFRNLKLLGCKDFIFFRSRKGTVEDNEICEFPSTDRLDEALRYRPAVAIISNPSSLHMEVAIPAARAGCDLYIEKPLSNDLQKVEELTAIARGQNLVVMHGCQFRFHPLLVSFRGQIAAGRLGQVIGASAEWGEYLPGWHPWEDYRRSCSAREELGGGVILTLIHPIDYLSWFFGPVRQVQAAVRSVPSLETSGEDWADITLEFCSGVLGQVHLDYLQRPPVHRLTVVGERGRATWDYHAGELAWTDIDGRVEIEKVSPSFERNTMFLDAMRHFLQCVADRGELQSSLAEGAAVLKWLLNARESARKFQNA